MPIRFFHQGRPPSLEGFFNERLIRSAPGSQVEVPVEGNFWRWNFVTNRSKVQEKGWNMWNTSGPIALGTIDQSSRDDNVIELLVLTFLKSQLTWRLRTCWLQNNMRRAWISRCRCREPHWTQLLSWGSDGGATQGGGCSAGHLLGPGVLDTEIPGRGSRCLGAFKKTEADCRQVSAEQIKNFQVQKDSQIVICLQLLSWNLLEVWKVPNRQWLYLYGLIYEP